MIALLREVVLNPDRRKRSDETPPVDAKLARKQQTEFAGILAEAGVRLKYAPAAADPWRGVMVESTAVLLPEAGVAARLTDAARASEVESVLPLLAQYRPIQRVSEPATLSGSDVLQVGHTLFVAQTPTTNAEGVAELKAIAEPFGYRIRPVELRDCAHLKRATSFIPPDYVLVNPAWANRKDFSEFTVVEVDASEPWAASTLSVAGTTVVSSAAPKTAKRLREAGIPTRRVDLSEFHKIGAGPSSLVLLVEPRVPRPPAPPAGFKVVRPSTARTSASLFAPAIVHGGVVYVSGQLPIDPATEQAVPGEIEAQTHQVLRNLSEVLVASGSSLARVLRLTFYLEDVGAMDRVAAICSKTFTGHKPAGSLVAAKAFLPGCGIAVDAIAAVAEER